jgi:hypothetical protein
MVVPMDDSRAPSASTVTMSDADVVILAGDIDVKSRGVIGRLGVNGCVNGY